MTKNTITNSNAAGMSVIVDTSVWSLALRRRTPPASSPIVATLQDLIATDQVAILGAIRQEILLGIRSADQFTHLRSYLSFSQSD
ncbi:MAG: hypothetical protein KME27_25590 [Lyngbya sp. HA4199-MV5]|jgi:hypothetical protein|nr:hypothetical protein [Lyngbya sp. HA4199-MV5]